VTERRHEVELTSVEVAEILALCGSEALLVGGQALAFWATYFGIAPVGKLSERVTSDVDFVGPARVARKLGKALRWTVWLPSIEDATAQTAKVTQRVPGGGVKQVDFLSAIVGLDTDRIQARAVEVTLASGTQLRILHPLDVLESRLRNVAVLPSKRDAAGVAQAELAIAIACRFIESLIVSGAGARPVLDAVERIAQIALDRSLAKVACEYGLDPLAAVPAQRIEIPRFQNQRWPQVLSAVAKLRSKITGARTARKKGPAGGSA